MIDNETSFHKFILDNPKTVMDDGSKIKILESEYKLYRAEKVLSREYEEFQHESCKGIIGRIDIIFRYGTKTYIAEIKNLRENGSFWYATKAMAYKEYYMFQTGKRNRNIVPAVIIPESHLKIEHRIVAGSLGIEIFSYNKTDSGYKMRKVVFL